MLPATCASLSLPLINQWQAVWRMLGRERERGEGDRETGIRRRERAGVKVKDNLSGHGAQGRVEHF